MVVALLAATTAEAQRAASVDLPPQLQLGAWRVEPSFAMHTGPNTNINKEANGISDFETALIPHLDVTLETQRGVLKSFAAIEFVRFAQHGIENGHSTYSDLQWEGRNTLFRPKLLFSRRNQGARASDFEEIGQKSRRLETTLSPGLHYGLPGAHVQLGGAFTHLRTRYDAAAIYQGSSLAEKLNFDRNTYSADAAVQLTPLTAMVVSGSLSQDRFLLTPKRNGNSVQATLGLEFAAKADITGSFGVGLKRASAPDPGAQPFGGLVWLGQLRHVGSKGTQIVLNLRRDTQYSYDVGQSYYIDTQSRLAVTQPLGEKVELFGQLGLLGLEYQGAVQSAERGVAVGWGLRYKIRTWNTIGVNVDKITRDGNAPWNAVRVVAFWAHGTRFMHLERTTPGDDYTK